MTLNFNWSSRILHLHGYFPVKRGKMVKLCAETPVSLGHCWKLWQSFKTNNIIPQWELWKASCSYAKYLQGGKLCTRHQKDDVGIITEIKPANIEGKMTGSNNSWARQRGMAAREHKKLILTSCQVLSRFKASFTHTHLIIIILLVLQCMISPTEAQMGHALCSSRAQWKEKKKKKKNTLILCKPGHSNNPIYIYFIPTTAIDLECTHKKKF